MSVSFQFLSNSSIDVSIYLWLYRALCWFLSNFSVSWSFTQSEGILGRGISQSQGRYLHTEQHKHRINAHRHPCVKWDSKPMIAVFERANPVHALDRAAGHCDQPVFLPSEDSYWMSLKISHYNPSPLLPPYLHIYICINFICLHINIIYINIQPTSQMRRYIESCAICRKTLWSTDMSSSSIGWGV
jgi:hypothetical protein